MHAQTDFNEQVTRQLAELIRHVGEVRRSNLKLEKGQQELYAAQQQLRAEVNELVVGQQQLRADVSELRVETAQLREAIGDVQDDVRSLKGQLTAAEDKLNIKFAHLADIISTDMVNQKLHQRAQFYEFQQTYETRISNIESRLEQLESAAQSKTA